MGDGLCCRQGCPSACACAAVPVLQCCASPCAAFPSCRSAHLVSRYRPRAPIIAVTRNDQTARQAHLYRGIFPVLCKQPAHDAWAEDVDLRVNLGMNVGECCAPASLWGLRQDLQQSVLLLECGGPRLCKCTASNGEMGRWFCHSSFEIAASRKPALL